MSAHACSWRQLTPPHIHAAAAGSGAEVLHLSHHAGSIPCPQHSTVRRVAISNRTTEPQNIGKDRVGLGLTEKVEEFLAALLLPHEVRILLLQPANTARESCDRPVGLVGKVFGLGLARSDSMVTLPESSRRYSTSSSAPCRAQNHLSSPGNACRGIAVGDVPAFAP